jgi:hypothetical protein
VDTRAVYADEYAVGDAGPCWILGFAIKANLKYKKYTYRIDKTTSENSVATYKTKRGGKK